MRAPRIFDTPDGQNQIVQPFRSFVAHKQDSPMAPKVKTTTQSLESMEATQADSPAEKPPEEELETQCTPDPGAPPKKNRGRPKSKASTTTTTKRRRTQAPLVKNVISKNIRVHPKIVQQVLAELENVCVERIKTKSVFRTRFFNVKLREARDAKRILEILPGKKLRQLCK